MPCAAVHLLLAGRILSEWEEGAQSAPVDVANPAVREAFLHGAMAPDMGFIPGVDRLLSELSHYVTPADLNRALLAAASVDEEAAAFSWGWTTHLIADVAIHPIIGRGVGEYLYGDRMRRVDAVENVAEHVSLEVGLDISILLANPDLAFPPIAPRFDSVRSRQIETAFFDAYGVGWDRSHLQRMHLHSARLCRWWPQILRVLAVGNETHWGKAAIPGTGAVTSALLGRVHSMMAPATPARGLFGPRLPPAWVLEEVNDALGALPAHFHALVQGKLAGMENRNLETGGDAGAGLGHPASDIAAEKLARVVSGGRRTPRASAA